METDANPTQRSNRPAGQADGLIQMIRYGAWRVADHSSEVHSFDLVEPGPEPRRLPNAVTEPSLLHELWGGFGRMVVDSARTASETGEVRQDKYYETFGLMRRARDEVVAGEAGAAITDPEVSRPRSELEETRHWLDSVQTSASWRITAPLRSAKHRLRSPKDG